MYAIIVYNVTFHFELREREVSKKQIIASVLFLAYDHGIAGCLIDDLKSMLNVKDM